MDFHSQFQAVEDISAGRTLGHIYVDAFARPGKAADCHFVIVGGRQVPNGSLVSSSSSTNSFSRFGRSSLGETESGDPPDYQTPVVTLCLNLPPPAGRPSLLHVSQVENVWHEMGHALHSMLGATKYQHVTGTRCPTDFAEVPSNLMEYLLYDTRVMKTVASHYTTGKPAPVAVTDNLCASRQTFMAQELQHTTFMALADLRLHQSDHRLAGSEAGYKGGAREDDLVADVYRQTYRDVFGSDPTDRTCLLHRFSHLATYGSKYYVYLVAQATAGLVWRKCLAQDPFSRSAGTHIRETLLKHGGEHPPAELVATCLGNTLNSDDMIDMLMSDVDKGKIHQL